MQNAPNGERNVSTRHYLDADSAMIDGKKWNLLESVKRWKRGESCLPRWSFSCQVPEKGVGLYEEKIIAAAVAIGVLDDRIPDLENREM